MYRWLILFVVPLSVVALPRTNGKGVVQLPLRRHHRPVLSARLQALPGSDKTRLRDIEHCRHVKEQGDNAQPLTRNFTDSGPFYDFGTIFRDEVFTIDVALGTPAKSFNATLDYRWEYSFFFSTGDPADARCVRPQGGGEPWRRDYDPKASSSAVNDPQLPQELFYLGVPHVPAGCTSDFTQNNARFNDTLTIAASSFNVPFIFIPDTWGNLDFYWPSDAILGLKRAYDPSDPIDDPIALAFFSPLGPPRASIERPVARGLPKSPTANTRFSKETSNVELNGQLTLGGVDTQNCDSKWGYVPVIQDAEGSSIYVTQ